MLVLTRRINETIVLPGPQVTIRVLSTKNNAVRMGIEAPPEVAVLRGELHERQRQRPDAAALEPVNGLVNRRVETARIGLEEARRCLQSGRTREAAETLARIDEDLAMLEQRLGGCPATLVPGESREALDATDACSEGFTGDRWTGRFERLVF